MRRIAISLTLAIAFCANTAMASRGPVQALDRFESGSAFTYGRYLPFGGYNAIPMVQIDEHGHIRHLYLDSSLRLAFGHIDNASAFTHLRAYSMAQRIGWIFRPQSAFRIVPFVRGALDLDSAGGLQTTIQTQGLTKTIFGSNPNDIKAGYEFGGGIEFQTAVGSRLVIAPFLDANYLRRVEETIDQNGQGTQTHQGFTILHYGAVADFRLIGPLDLYAEVQFDRVSGHGLALGYSGGVALRF